jgi:hypothetical protein
MRAALLVVVGLAIAGCGPTTPSRTPAIEGAACNGSPDLGVLPEWARAGFSNPAPVMPHVFTSVGDIVAILFGDPLSSPPSPDHSNKILWVSLHRSATSGLTISAQRMAGTEPLGESVAVRLDHFPGPSYVDLPAPGCWRLTLDGPDWRDMLDLEYVAPR